MLNLSDEQRAEINKKLRDSYVVALGSTKAHQTFYNGETLGDLTRRGLIGGYTYTSRPEEALKAVLSHQDEGHLVVIIHGVNKIRAGKDGALKSIPCPARQMVLGEAIAKRNVHPIYFDAGMAGDSERTHRTESGVTRVLPTSATMDHCPDHVYKNILPLAFLVAS